MFRRFGARAGIALRSPSQWRDNAGTETGHTGKRCMRGADRTRQGPRRRAGPSCVRSLLLLGYTATGTTHPASSCRALLTCVLTGTASSQSAGQAQERAGFRPAPQRGLKPAVRIAEIENDRHSVMQRPHQLIRVGREDRGRLHWRLLANSYNLPGQYRRLFCCP